MESFDKSLSSSTHTQPSAIPKFSPSDAGEADENGLNYDQMTQKLQNPKKPPMKHFMSPTISASSKAAVPRKKILAERNNEASIFADAHHHNHPNLDKSDRLHIRRGSESDDDEQNNIVSDSSHKLYDPLTNYLSPRPKFLRYKPNRRSEIFLRQENEKRERKEGYGGVKRSVSFDSQRDIVKEDSSENPTRSLVGSSSQEDEEETNKKTDEEAEEFEEEEETCSNLKSVMQYLLVFAILLFSTLYISSMNSPTPSPNLQSIWGLENGYYQIHNHTFGVVNLKIFEGRSGSLVQRKKGINIEIESDDVGFKEGVTVQESSINGLLLESTDEVGEVMEMQNRQSKCVYDLELEKKEEGGCVGFQKGENVDDHNLEKTREGIDQLKGVESGNEAHGYSSIKVGEMEGGDKIETIQEISVEGAEEEVIESKMERDEDSEIFMLEELDNEADVTSPQREVNSVDATIKDSKTELFLVTVIMILATSVLMFHFRSKKTPVKQSLPVEKLLVKSVLAEISSIEPVLPNVEEEELIEKVESFENPSYLIRSSEEASMEFYQSRAPTVEFLGELVFGDMVNSSLNSCSMKNKTVEVEESNNYVSQEKGPRSNAHVVVSSQAQPSSEFSSMNSTSFGSFTAEKKIVRKEDGKDGEVRTAVVVTTPVRRSSRIRNRVLSP